MEKLTHTSSLPNRLAALIFILLIVLVVGTISTIRYSYLQIERIYDVHIPLLEDAEINVRLHQEIYRMIELSIYAKDPSLLDDYELAQSSLSGSIKNFKKGLKEIDHLSFETQYLDRNALSKLELQLVEVVRQGDFAKAGQLLESDHLQGLLAAFSKATFEVAEVIARERSTFISEQKAAIRWAIVASIGLSFLILGLFIAALKIYRDMQKRRALAERKLEETQSMSIQNSKLAALGEMAGGVAHEINNPLAIISGYSEIMVLEMNRETPNLEIVKKRSTEIVKVVRRIARIIKSLKSFARDASSDPFELFELPKIVEDSLSMSQEKFRASGVDIQVFNVSKIHPLNVYCRPIEIAQVLINLLNNSFDAIRDQEEPWIKIILNDTKDRIRLTVMDSGDGIPPDLQDKIMQPFFTTKGVGEGTGLGLSISIGILQAHRAQLVIDNKSANTKFDILFEKPEIATIGEDRIKSA